MKGVKKKKARHIAIIVAVIVLITLAGFALLIYGGLVNNMAKVIEEDMSNVEDRIDHVIDNNYDILQAFSAYVQTTDQLSASNIQGFLDVLVKDADNQIRNLSILEDTTIIWNYPVEGNQAAIGLDLSQLPNQKDEVLRVKSNGESILTGPVNLVQGGTGYVIRMPIYKDGNYYGQTSIVIDGGSFDEFLTQLENEFNIEFMISSAGHVIYNESYQGSDDDVVYQLKTSMYKWQFHVKPDKGWVLSGPWFTFVPFVIIIVSVLIGFKVFTLYLSHNKDQAYIDPLTGLYNRLYLYKYAESLLNMASINQLKIGVILIDIDGIKAINETYGPFVGDGILAAFSTRVKEELKTGQEVFRISGDEFVITMENIKTRDQVTAFSDHIKYELENHIILKDFDIKLSIGFGVSLYPEDGETLEILYNLADQNLYKNTKQ